MTSRERRGVPLRIRLRPAEAAALERARAARAAQVAAAGGPAELSLSEYVRLLIAEAADRADRAEYMRRERETDGSPWSL